MKLETCNGEYEVRPYSDGYGPATQVWFVPSTRLYTLSPEEAEVLGHALILTARKARRNEKPPSTGDQP